MASRVQISYTVEDGIISSAIPLSEVLGVDRTTIANYAKEGMPFITYGKQQRYKHRDCITWVNENKDINKELKEMKTRVEIKEIEVRTKIRELDKKVKEGKLISYEEVDEELARHNSLLINQYRRLLNTLPRKLAKKTQLLIKRTLDTAFSESINELRGMLD